MDQNANQLQSQTPPPTDNPVAQTPPAIINQSINFYPKILIKNNDHPSRLLAFPFFGIVIKIILLIPVFLYSVLLSLRFFVTWIILPFVIVFTGKYWDPAYTFIVKYMKYNAKISYYVYGITDKYPGFSLSEDGLFELTMEKPVAPNRGLAFPFLGYLVRIIMLIPYLFYINILQNAAQIALVVSWFAVLFKGKYPESLYELNRDSVRVSLASTAYMAYMSDKYPSFWISMNHKNVKIILIVLGIIFGALNSVSDLSDAMNELRTPPQNNADYAFPSTDSSETSF